MRKFHLFSAIAFSALMTGCAQTSESARNADFCSQLSPDAFLQAVDQGQCDLDVTTAAGGESRPDKAFGHDDGDHGGEKDAGDSGKEPDHDPDTDSGTEGGESGGGGSGQAETDHL